MNKDSSAADLWACPTPPDLTYPAAPCRHHCCGCLSQRKSFRYFFASGTAYVTAMVGLFATLILQIPGVDPAQVMLILLVPMGIMGILTPYGTGHSPIWFASGYNKGPEFWKLGAIFGIIYLAIFIVVGIPWIEFVMPLLG